MISGRHVRHEGQDLLVLTRDVHAPVEKVWDWFTDPGRLALWFGTWEGDPASGRVDVRWGFEEVPVEPYVIEVCEPPEHLRVHNETQDPDEAWTLDVRLAPGGEGTILVFTQVLDRPEKALDCGPGWEYYLNRLEDSLRTGHESTVHPDGYLPMQPEYAREFGLH